MTERELKNQRIKETLAKTREKRKTQKCKVFELKLDTSHFNSKTKEALKMMFVEAKWLYNYYLSQEDIFKLDTKIGKITHKDKEGRMLKLFFLLFLQKLNSQLLKGLKAL